MHLFPAFWFLSHIHGHWNCKVLLLLHRIGWSGSWTQKEHQSFPSHAGILQKMGEKVFFNFVLKDFSLVSVFPKQKTLFLRQTCLAFSQVKDVGLLHFDCPKTNFQSSKFHEISNLKNEQFDQNMPYSRVIRVCMVLRTTKSLNLCGFRVRYYRLFLEMGTKKILFRRFTFFLQSSRQRVLCWGFRHTFFCK